MSSIVTGLDIGTSFIRAVIGEITPDPEGKEPRVDIIGIAKLPSEGVRNGRIINIEKTMDCIKRVVAQAERIAGEEVFSCFPGIGGAQVESMNTKGMVAISSRGRKNREITEDDVARVLEASKAVQIPGDKMSLHLIPQHYIVDGVSGCKDPLNMIAVRLEAEVHIVTVSRQAIQNITLCVERAGYRRDTVMLKTLAAMNVVMTSEEREQGSILIDLGGGTTDVLLVVNDAPIFTASIPVGGNLVTNDISIVKGISTTTAESVKVTYGCCFMPLAQENDAEVLIPGIAGHEPDQSSRSELCEIIQPRMEEIFMMVRDEIMRRTNVQSLYGNVILTGGGAQIDGAVDLAKAVFGTSSVRLGVPLGDLGKFDEDKYRLPEYATAVGLVVANKKSVFPGKAKKEKRPREGDDGQNNGESFLQKIKKMFF